MNYRSDIDGLRAVAVVPVVLFHANIAGFSGGFVGVDIFFVISGFLITSIIHKELSDSRFSIVRFYERRARRILPALFTVMIACLVAGWFILPPAAYGGLGESVLSALLFVSNIWFWKNSGGYFDGTTDYLPMLHTWSLAVEEQFYIFFPLILMVLHRVGRRLLFISTPSCPPLIGALHVHDKRGLFRKCKPFRISALQHIETLHDIETVIVAARWPMYITGQRMPGESLDQIQLYREETNPGNAQISDNAEIVAQSLRDLWDSIVQNGRRLVLIGTVPELPWHVADRMTASILFGRPMPEAMTLQSAEARQASSQMLLENMATHPDVIHVPIVSRVCNPTCPTYEGTTAYYRDGNHLTHEGAMALLPAILDPALSDLQVSGRQKE